MEENERKSIPEKKLEKVTGGWVPTVNEHGYDDYTKEVSVTPPEGYTKE